MPYTPISVVVITFNEERNLGRCLDSVQEVADDIVVVDSFSSDKTEEIALSKGARFIQHKFEGHIQQKNWAITQAKFPHILSLDADEALSDQLKISIQSIKNNFSADGYSMNRLTNYCGKWIKHCGWYPDKKLRLWDSRKGSWRGVNPHDRYELDQASRIDHLKGDILHYSYYTIDDHYRQTDYFTTIAANALFAAGKKPSFVKRFFSPVFKFFRDFILKLGFLDGYYGWVVCKISAQATWQKYKKLSLLWEGKEL